MDNVQNNPRENEEAKKGFTLVELIAVLIIVVILAAILVPALMSYAEKAAQKKVILNAKSCLTAAQAELSNLYAQDIATVDENAQNRILSTALDDPTVCEALTIGCDAEMVAGKREGYKVNYIYYKEGGKEIYYDGNEWVETAPAAPAKSYIIAYSAVSGAR
jgi:prepilin-type N-terminal cleavage/methylation domain-containing protein